MCTTRPPLSCVKSCKTRILEHRSPKIGVLQLLTQERGGLVVHIEQKKILGQ